MNDLSDYPEGADDKCPNCGHELEADVDHAGGLQCMDGGMYCNCPWYGYCNDCGYDTRTGKAE